MPPGSQNTESSTRILVIVPPDSGVGEGGQGGGATAPPPPTVGHDCILKFNEEKIPSCSMSATVAT